MELTQDALGLLRSQRHAFINHLQVITGWLQLQQPERATQYIARIADRLEAEGQVLRNAQPALAVALLAAGVAAEAAGVVLDFRLPPLPGLDLPQPEHAGVLRRFLGAAVSDLIAMGGPEERRLAVLITGGDRHLRLALQFPGPLPGSSQLATLVLPAGCRLEGELGPEVVLSVTAV